MLLALPRKFAAKTRISNCAECSDWGMRGVQYPVECSVLAGTWHMASESCSQGRTCLYFLFLSILAIFTLLWCFPSRLFVTLHCDTAYYTTYIIANYYQRMLPPPPYQTRLWLSLANCTAFSNGQMLLVDKLRATDFDQNAFQNTFCSTSKSTPVMHVQA